jgi:hypothetical protein
MTPPYSNPWQLHFKRKKIAIIILVAGLVYVLLFGLRIDWFMPQQFASARAVWDAKNIKHYRVVVFVSGFCAPPCGAEMSIEVRNNQVIAVDERPGLFVGHYDEYPYQPLSPEKWDQYRVNEYTIDAMFQRVADRIATVPAIYITSGGGINYDITYDSEFSYVKSFLESGCGQGGLLMAASDCAGGFSVRDFETLA